MAMHSDNPELVEHAEVVKTSLFNSYNVLFCSVEMLAVQPLTAFLNPSKEVDIQVYKQTSSSEDTLATFKLFYIRSRRKTFAFWDKLLHLTEARLAQASTVREAFSSGLSNAKLLPGPTFGYMFAAFAIPN